LESSRSLMRNSSSMRALKTSIAWGRSPPPDPPRAGVPSGASPRDASASASEAHPADRGGRELHRVGDSRSALLGTVAQPSDDLTPRLPRTRPARST
jgi:hypothetical protein